MASGMALPNQKKKVQSPLDQMYGLYGKSVEKQAGDYDDIMSRFKNIYADAQRDGNAGFSPVTAERAQYNKSADTTAALANLRDLTETGGLSAADQQNLRARAVSPIRSMYQNAARDMQRQRSLSGGYSPNFGAVTARMTRDMSSGIANQLDNANAGIAEMVQKGKLSAAPNYASAAQAESELGNSFSKFNAGEANAAAKFNAQNMFDAARQKRNDMNEAARGMTSLYGTTPALSNLYGNQAQNAAEFQNNVNQQKKKTALSGLGGMTRGF